jgi:hypothetical protein
MKIETRIVVPCYEEAERLAGSRFLHFARSHPSIGFIFVDDGSRDNTSGVLERLCSLRPRQLEWIRLPVNRGKGEAVRQGCLHAFARSSRQVGYWDADLATPLESIPSFLDALERWPAVQLILGSRIQMLGRFIHRHVARHALGRIFAAAAAWTLDLPVYDTQCGAKLFRSTFLLRSTFAEPFQTRWLFDVEILARLIAAIGTAAVSRIVREEPLACWRDVAGSKVMPLDFFRALLELPHIRRRYLAPHRRPLLADKPSFVSLMRTQVFSSQEPSRGSDERHALASSHRRGASANR